MNDCIFCKIIVGELPATKIYEDSDVIAFMDINPIAKGHALVVPKIHSATISDTDDEVLAKVMAVVKRVAKSQLAALGADGVNVTQANGAVAGQVVPHIHFHVIPRSGNDNVHFNWQPQSYNDSGEMTEYAQKIRAHIDGL